MKIHSILLIFFFIITKCKCQERNISSTRYCRINMMLQRLNTLFDILHYTYKRFSIVKLFNGVFSKESIYFTYSESTVLLRTSCINNIKQCSTSRSNTFRFFCRSIKDSETSFQYLLTIKKTTVKRTKHNVFKVMKIQITFIHQFSFFSCQIEITRY